MKREETWWEAFLAIMKKILQSMFFRSKAARHMPSWKTVETNDRWTKLAAKNKVYAARLEQVSAQMASHTTLSVAIAFAIAAVAVFLSYACIGVWIQRYDGPWWLVALTTFIPGLLLWSYIFFKRGMLNAWFINVKPLHVAVMRQQIGGSEATAYREIWPGWHGRLPWEELASEPISLEKTILIGHSVEDDDPLTVYVDNAQKGDLDEAGIQKRKLVPLDFEWQTAIGVLLGFCVEYIQYEDDKQIEYFRAQFAQYLEGWAAGKTDEQVLRTLSPGSPERKEFQKDFNLYYSGKDDVDPEEMERGMFTGDPQFRNVKYQAAYLQAMQTGAIIDRIGDGCEELIKVFKGHPSEKRLDLNVALMVSSAAAGIVEKMNPVVLVGLDGADPGALRAIRDMTKQTQKSDK